MCNLSDRIEERGIRKGYLNAAMLIQKLNEAGRLNDIERAMTDEDYRAALFQEFGIIPAITAQAQARAEAQALQ